MTHKQKEVRNFAEIRKFAWHRILNFWNNLQTGCNPYSTKFVIVRFQSKPSPVHYSNAHLCRTPLQCFRGDRSQFFRLQLLYCC